MQLSKSFLISEIPLFDDLTVDEVREVEKWMTLKKLDKGKVVYRQGTTGQSVCFVVEGKLKVVVRNEESDVIIATVSKGDTVGELALIDGLSRSADVIAADETTVLILKRDNFNRLVEEQPGVGVKMLRSLAKAISMTLRDRSETLARLEYRAKRPAAQAS